MVGYYDVYVGFGVRLGLSKEEGVVCVIVVIDDGDFVGGGVGMDGLDVFFYKWLGDCLFC